MQNKTPPATTSAETRCRLGPEDFCFAVAEDSFSKPQSSTGSFAIIGQERAMLAIEMALKIRAKGYNLFVTGPAGTGKRTAIHAMLDSLEHDLERVKDICLVHNFAESDSPLALFFPRGKAARFRAELRSFLLELSEALADLSNQSQFRDIRNKLVLNIETEQQQLIFDFEGRLTREGFKIVQGDDLEEGAADILPLINNEVSNFDDLQALVIKGEMSESDFSQLRQRRMTFINEMNDLLGTLQKRRRDVDQELSHLKIEILKPQIEKSISALAINYPYDGVESFLNEVMQDLLSDTSFIHQTALPRHGAMVGMRDESSYAEEEGADRQRQADGRMQVRSQSTGGRGRDLPDPLKKYDVNILVDHGSSKSNPIISEAYPDYAKVFGYIENPGEQGYDSSTSHLLVRAGSLLKASGGYLILRAEDILRDEDAYITLKRTLQDEAVEVRHQPSLLAQGTPAVKTSPIPIDVKVIIMGGDGVYEVLFDRDEDFQKLFKIPAEFDYSVDLGPAVFQAYAEFFFMIQEEEKLLPLSQGATAALLRYAVRLAEFRNKLCSKFSLLADIAKEGDWWARRAGSGEIAARHIAKALEARQFLYNLPEEKIDEQIIQGEILLDVRGKAIGRINGLAVMDRGYYSFGRPTVISAQVSPGSEGVVNMEREAGLSGEIHDKGTFIVASWLQASFAHDFPLSINASICFEQSYSEVDGDSASSTEVFALLSSITRVPLRQDIAVTGSVNQMGEIQPVGGVIEKIEGFFSVCKKIGLTGTQGVIIPKQNLLNLILSHEVEQALLAGRFHLWSISTIEEGIEILTGIPAGTRNARGQFAPGTMFAMVDTRLREMAKAVKEWNS